MKTKIKVEKIVDLVANRWQMEVLKIVTQLLGYDAVISEKTEGDQKSFTIVAEEKGKTHPCKYIRITKDQDGNGEVTFEHFDTEKDLEREKVKFAALAQKLGVYIALSNSPIQGKPVSSHTHNHTEEHHSHKH